MFKVNKLNKLLKISNEYCNLHQLKKYTREDYQAYDENAPFNPDIERDDNKESKQVLKSLKIKPLISMEDSFEEAPNEILLNAPFSMLMIAKPGSGKSTTLINLINWYTGYFDSIIVISPTIGIDSSWVTAMETGLINIKRENIFNRFDEAEFGKIFKKIQTKNEGIKNYSEKLKVLFLFDDIVGDMPSKKRTVINNFARNHRHYGISHITLSQEYNSVPPVLRKNCYGICFYDSDNGLEREAIIRNNCGKIGRNRFINMWNESCNEKFSFLFVKPYETDLLKKFYRKFDKYLDYRTYDNKKVLIDVGDAISETKIIVDEEELNDEDEEEISNQELLEPQLENKSEMIEEEKELDNTTSISVPINDEEKKLSKSLNKKPYKKIKKIAELNNIPLKNDKNKRKTKKQLIEDIIENMKNNNDFLFN